MPGNHTLPVWVWDKYHAWIWVISLQPNCFLTEFIKTLHHWFLASWRAKSIAATGGIRLLKLNIMETALLFTNIFITREMRLYCIINSTQLMIHITVDLLCNICDGRRTKLCQMYYNIGPTFCFYQITFRSWRCREHKIIWFLRTKLEHTSLRLTHSGRVTRNTTVD